MRLLFILLAAVSALTSWAQSTYVLRAKPFTELAVSGSVDVVCREVPDSASLVVFTANAQALEALQTAHAAGTLTISLTRQLPKGALSTVVVYLDSPLQMVSVRGSAKVSVPRVGTLEGDAVVILNGSGSTTIGTLNADMANVSLNGNGHLTLGRANAKVLNLNCSGSGRLSAETISATTLNLNLRGSGSLSAAGNVKKTTSAVASGTGQIDIRHLTTPRTTQSRLTPTAKILTH